MEATHTAIASTHTQDEAGGHNSNAVDGENYESGNKLP